jgi:hypothetical protein
MDGIVDGTTVNAADLTILYYDEQRREWKEIENVNGVKGGCVEKAGNSANPGSVSAIVRHFTLFGVFYYSAKETLDDILVYPNPFKPCRGHEKITFDGLTQNARVRIYTITGRGVDEVLSDGMGKAEWDVTTGSGETVASGVYLYCITDDRGHRKTGKLAVLR